ncbi:Thiamine kinase [Escherichia coli]|nr:Thiamine kinase [Escherichia coli]
MVVDYLPGEVKTYLPDTNELAGLLYYLHQQPRFGWRITLLPLLELYWQQSESGAADSGLAANVKTSAQSAGTTAFTLKSIAYGMSHAGI